MTIRLLVGCLISAVATVAAAQGTQYHLASAQVVLADTGPRLLLAADGPIAHAVEPEPDGAPAPPDRLRLRLYGVTPTAALVAGAVPLFTVQATTAGRDTVLLVLAPGLPAAARLEVGTSPRASELTILVR